MTQKARESLSRLTRSIAPANPLVATLYIVASTLGVIAAYSTGFEQFFLIGVLTGLGFSNAFVGLVRMAGPLGLNVVNLTQIGASVALLLTSAFFSSLESERDLTAADSLEAGLKAASDGRLEDFKRSGRHGLTVHYTCDGRRVTRSMEMYRADRYWLVLPTWGPPDRFLVIPTEHPASAIAPAPQVFDCPQGGTP